MRAARRILPSLAVPAALAIGTAGCPARPAAPPPLAAAVLVPPLHDAEPGEELRMRRGNEEWTWRVTSTTDTEVEADFTVRRDGEPVGPPKSQRWTRNGFGIPDEFVIREARRDRIEVGGRTWDCWMLRVHSRTGIRYYWISDALPAHGVLRIAVEDRGRPVLATAADAVPEACVGGSGEPR